MSLVYLNDKLYPEEQALISVFDHGFLYGDGVFETLRAYGGRIFQMEAHLERLYASASAIYLNIPYNKSQLSEALYLTLKENQLAEASLRLSISRGPGTLGLDPDKCPRPTLVIIANPAPTYPPSLYRQGVAVTIADTRRTPPSALNPEIKSANFLNNILAKIEAKKAGAFEAIMLNQEGYLCEGTVSNIFFVQEGVLKTPARAVGLLPGITRKVVLEIARRAGISSEEELFRQEDLFCADEVFLTNSGIELLPVVQIDGRPIGNGTPGKITRQLSELFKAEVSLSPHLDWAG